MLKVGLTGGIACGKSKALEFLKTLGAHTIDADQLAREVVEPGEPALEKIRTNFGNQYIAPDGSLDRAAMAELVFSDESARQELNHIIHPHILDRETELLSRIEKNIPHDKSSLVIVDAPLMIEVGTYTRYDYVIVIYCPLSTQIKRLISRNTMSEEQAINRINSQMPTLEKIHYCDYVINSSGPVDETRGQIRFIYKELLMLSRETRL
jgi:dephospho-CoA kinase